MISIVFPTRGRPDNIRRLFQSVQNTASVKPDIVLYIDADDEASVLVARELSLSYFQGPRQMLAQSYNAAMKLAQGDIIMFGADDIVFREKDWDIKVEAEFAKFNDRIAFVYGNDGGRSDELGTHGFLHRNWINTVGYLLPPYFETWYVDNWITDVARALERRIYLPYVIAEHMHPCWGKAPNDSTYAEAEKKQSADTARWGSLIGKRNEDVEKLREFIKKS